MTVSFDFSGQTVLVTGASRGIGFGVAQAFADAGARVCVLAEDAGIEKAARTLSATTGGNVRALRCDISDPDAVHRALDGFGRLDVLINNAGVELPTPVEEGHSAIDDAFRRIIDVNVMGTWWVTRAALPQMGEGGRILITSSIWGRTAVPGFAAYVASKHALIGIARTLSRELGPRGIRVNAVCPGWVRTEASLRSLAVMAQERGISEDAMGDALAANQSLDGLMDPTDVAGLYLYLASEAAANLTGQAIQVDRGEVMA
ncbi:3-hydroxybutyrate dehydrogenase [Modicisalibacter ilicicola DSM 19980]|uniref:3-hydroxybutyrate dehydrogenase n=1 Tax=Modicisalibacter ilicicola DSM 19980 TaxID=1121942 RepID=A0A1M4W6D7_9GAMM|nr:SDR family NAD(P)-dependent oxidoreductase [Halomonas ilicicola]SHE76844.1 3-hydroxybutyrate dehydrogenase [Halomonas ilicicola DSM 19980]